MNALSNTLRRAIGAPPPVAPDALQAMRAAIWEEVQQAEAQRPQILRALRDQQEQLRAQGQLR